MQLVGTKPSPRLLVVGDHTKELAATMSELAPTVKWLKTLGGIKEVRQKDYDGIILLNVDAQESAIAAHLFVLQFGRRPVPDVFKSKGGGVFTLQFWHHSVANEHHIPDDLPAGVRGLVERDLLVKIRAAGRADYVHLSQDYGDSVSRLAPPTDSIRPMLADADGKIIALINQRSLESSAQRWYVPWFADMHSDWIRAALRAWREADSVRFPSVMETGWERQPRWMTTEEQAHVDSIAALRNERDAAIATFEVALEEQSALLESATAQADEAERTLLTGQGDPLVRQVRVALAELGFDTIDVDEATAVKGDKLEDLRIVDPSDTEWVALAEVRGYGRGAQVNDLMRIARFVTRYVKSHGTEPAARWYVVNQFRESDPTARPQPLASNPVEVETFSEDGGAVIDTRVLFELVMRARRGDLDLPRVRAALRTVTGQVSLETVCTPDADASTA